MSSCWAPRKKEHPDVWGRCRIYGPETGVPGPRNPYLTPYTIDFGRSVGSGTHKLDIFVTGAQSGKTETFLDIVGERLDNRPVPILYVGPSKEFLTDQFEPRLRDLFLQSDSLLSKIVGGIDGKRQKKTLKRVAGVTVRLGSAGSSTALKSNPFGLALVDEYDEMLRKLRDQGDILGLIMARGITYADFCAAVTSTPSQGLVDTEFDEKSGLEFWAVGDEDAITSPIWRLWQRGTRHHWCWPCPHCGDYFVLRRKQLRYPDDATPAEALANAWIECPRCTGRIYEHHKADLNARAQMVAPGETISKRGIKSGTPLDTYPSRWASALASPFVTLGQRSKAYLAAHATRESAKIQTAINAEFGECAPPISTDALAWEDVQTTKAVGLKRREVHDDVVSITGTIDVQKYKLVYVIRGFGARATSWLIDNGELHGPTKDLAVWDEAGDLLTSTFGGMHLKIGLVDSGFRPGQKAFLPVNRVYDFCRRYRRFVYPIKGSSHPMSRPIVESAIEVAEHDGSPRKYGLRLLRLDQDHWKSTVHERLSLGADAPGCLHLNADVDEDYCRQLVSETRVAATNGGGFLWVKSQKDNHYLDCEAMAAAAAYKINAQDFGANAAARRRERAGLIGAVRQAVVQAVALPAPAAPIAAAPRRSGSAVIGGMGSWARRFNH